MSHYHDQFKSLACYELGGGSFVVGRDGGNVSLVTEQSCIGEYGKSLFQMPK